MEGGGGNGIEELDRNQDMAKAIAILVIRGSWWCRVGSGGHCESQGAGTERCADKLNFVNLIILLLMCLRKTKVSATKILLFLRKKT